MFITVRVFEEKGSLMYISNLLKNLSWLMSHIKLIHFGARLKHNFEYG